MSFNRSFFVGLIGDSLGKGQICEMGLFKKKLKKEASPKKVNKYVRGAVRQFSFWFAHGTIGVDLLNGIDYTSSLREESSFAEQAYIVFMNNLEYDSEGVTNFKHAEYRAAQYVRSYFDPQYQVEPPFELWEMEGDSVSKDSWNC